MLQDFPEPIFKLSSEHLTEKNKCSQLYSLTFSYSDKKITPERFISSFERYYKQRLSKKHYPKFVGFPYEITSPKGEKFIFYLHGNYVRHNYAFECVNTFGGRTHFHCCFSLSPQSLSSLERYAKRYWGYTVIKPIENVSQFYIWMSYIVRHPQHLLIPSRVRINE